MAVPEPYEYRQLKIESPLLDVPAEMPVDVLLILPDYVTADPSAQRFNLPGALGVLLGRFGWERAQKIMRPWIWAPGWADEDFRGFVAEPFRGADHEFSSIDASDVRVHSISDDVEPDAHYDVVHYFGRVDKAVYLGGDDYLAPDALIQLLEQKRTRLLILHVERRDFEMADDMARHLVLDGVPSVLVVAARDQNTVDAYYLDLYAGIIHNQDLTEDARPPASISVEDVLARLYYCRGGYGLLRFDRWLDEIGERFRQELDRVREQRHRLDSLKTRASAYLHRSQLETMMPRMEDAGERAARAAADLETAAPAVAGDLNWAHESGGAEPLSRVVDALDDAEEEAGELEAAYHELEEALSEAALHAPRVLNANFGSPATGRLLRSDEGLLAGESYDLLVDIGPAWDKVESIVTGRAEFPEEALERDTEGYDVQAVLIMDAFSPGVVSADMWVPRNSGRSFPVIDGDRAAKPGPVALRFRTPNFAEDAGAAERHAHGRLCLYFEQNLIQSASVTAVLVRSPDVSPTGRNRIEVDYRLSGTLKDVESRYGTRTLSLTEGDGADGHPIAVSLAVNSDPGGGHRIIVKDRPEVPPARVAYDPVGAVRVLEDARRALLNCFWKRDDRGNPLVNQNGFTRDNGKPRKAFAHDVFYLARVGHQLYSLVFQELEVEGTNRTPKDWDWSISKALQRSGIIQAARTTGSPRHFILPWGLMYEYPLPGPRDKIRYCDVFTDEWREDGVRTKPLADCCPFHDRPWHRQNVLCPYGFWGLKHVVEQPVTVLDRPVDAQGAICTDGSIVLSIGATSDTQLDAAALSRHLDEVSTLQGMMLADPPPNPARDREAVRSLLERSAIVYFLCHGEFDAGQNEPYLGIGLRDGRDLHRIYPSTVTAWARTGLELWAKQHPLVVINGCHTSNLTPGEILNFVSSFAAAGAGGVIGTEVSVRLPLASEVAGRLLSKIVQKVPVGQAMREVRWELANKGNLLGLAYTAYGLADLRIAVRDANGDCV